FIENADRERIPLLFVQDVSGFMVGTEAEHSGIIRAGARFVEAMATATVPKLVLTVNHASGAGYYAMAGQGFDPDFIVSWPTGRVGVMEGESAVQAVYGGDVVKAGNSAAVDAMRADYDHQLDARFAGARGFVDALVLPEETRDTVSFLLEVATEFTGPHLGPFVLPRDIPRQDEGPEVRAGEFRGDFQQKRHGVAGFLRKHERVHEAACARESGVELMVVVGAHGVDGGAVAGFDHVAAIDGLDGGLPFHYAHTARRPRDDEIGVESLPRHGVVAGARCVIHREHQLRHGGRRHRFDEPRSGANDPGVLRLGADHEPGHVLNEEEGQALAVGIVDEVGHLLRALGVDNAADLGGLALLSLDDPARIGDDRDRAPGD